jgi:hypothetical protein
MKTNTVNTLMLGVALIFSGATYAQNVQINWQKNYGGTANDIATDIVRTSDGGYAVAGYTSSNNIDVTGAISGEDAWILRLNAQGNIIWKRIYGGSSDDRANAIIQTGNGDLIFAGTTNSANGDISNPNGGFDAWAVRLNSNGDVIWSRNLGGSDDDAFFDVTPGPDASTLLFAGESKSDIEGTMNKGGYDYYLASVDRNNGSTIFQKQYGGSSDEGARALTRFQGATYLVGTTASDNGDVTGNKGGTDVWLVRAANNGNLTLAKTYGGPDNDEGNAIGRGSFLYLTGSTLSSNGDLNNNFGNRDFFVAKVDGQGMINFARNYGGGSDDVAYEIVATPDGGAIVAGYSESATGNVGNNFGAKDIWAAKLGANGNLQLARNFGGADDEIAYSFVPVSPTSVVFAGYSESDDVNLNSNNGNADYWVFRVTSSPAANVGDFAAAEPVSVEEITLSTYPNPAVEVLTVQSTAELTQVRLFDMTGRMVRTELVNTTQFDMNVSDLASGIYILTAVATDGTNLKQNVVVK